MALLLLPADPPRPASGQTPPYAGRPEMFVNLDAVQWIERLPREGKPASLKFVLKTGEALWVHGADAAAIWASLLAAAAPSYQAVG